MIIQISFSSSIYFSSSKYNDHVMFLLLLLLLLFSYYQFLLKLVLLLLLFCFCFSFIEYFFIALFQVFMFQDVSGIFWNVQCFGVHPCPSSSLLLLSAEV